jgi:antitoxin CptB|tara:strand:- start:45 stop:299 length:255 start_codon:yes stop_codon:yes gene_type:complete
MSESESLKKKIIYRANYRGTKEMDILLSKFVDKYIQSFSDKQLNELFEFLNLEDEIILNYYQRNILDSKIKNNEILNLFKNFKL